MSSLTLGRPGCHPARVSEARYVMLTREFNDLMLKRIGCGADGSFSSPSPLDWNRAPLPPWWGYYCFITPPNVLHTVVNRGYG
eukprot:750867-Hanusia_phi.AAC.1